MSVNRTQPYPVADWAEHHRVSGESFHLARRQMSGVFHFATHGHLDYYEWVLVTAGRLTHLRPGASNLSDGPGTLRLMRPGDFHGLEGRDLAYVNLAFPAVWLDRFASLWEDPTLVKRIHQVEAPPQARVKGAELKQLLAGVEVLLSLRFGVEARRHFAELLGKSLSFLVASLPDGESPSPGLPWVISVAKYIEENLAEDLSPGDLAARVGVSGAHLARSFHRQYGVAPTQYLLSLRLERAANLLSGTDDPVTAVALASGWSDPGHFTRMFHRRYGASPLAWRKRHQGILRSSAPVSGDGVGPRKRTWVS